MSQVDELLAVAHAHVTHAAAVLARGEGFEAAAATSRCLEIAAMLEDCGALPNADLLGELVQGQPGELLRAAGEVLEQIPASSRPLRLVSVRAELTGLILELSESA